MSLSVDGIAKLRLARTPRVGSVTFQQLLRRFETAEDALVAIPELAMRGGGTQLKIASLADIEGEAKAVERLGARYVFWGDADYPELLAQSDSAPSAMIIIGDLALASKPCVAIVGARNASAAACRFSRDLALGLADMGVAVVSGLARGIDTAAHQGALKGGTIGVIASGIDIAYPPENHALQAAVANEGLLIAEQPPGREPLARHFPSRNRIIAGLSLGTVVVEAAPKSGSLITARLAAEMGRDVMAVPGSPIDPRAQGCNQLIRDGATLIQNAEDVMEVIGGIGGGVAQSRTPYTPEPFGEEPEDIQRIRIIELLSPAPVGIDEIVRLSGASPAQVQLVLLEQELAGKATRHAGGRVSSA